MSFANFVKALIAGGFFWHREGDDALLSVVYMMEDSYKWETEHRDWVAAGCPDEWSARDMGAAVAARG